MSKQGMLISPDTEYNPSIRFENKQIDQFLKEKFDSLNVGDKLTLTIDFKVVSVSKREERDYESSETTKKTKKCVELELISVDKNSIASGKASMQQHKAGI